MADLAKVDDSDREAPGRRVASPAASRGDHQAVVVDNLPIDIPITARELMVIETYVADLLDQLFDETAVRPDNTGD